MKVLIVGSGGREHTLAWKIAKSPKVDKLYAAPGNGGIAGIAECIDINPEDIEALKDFVKEQRVDLTIVGPEVPLEQGIVDTFAKAGLFIFGPARKAARIEGSKVFAKELMLRYGVPTAAGEIFDDPAAAKIYINKHGAPLVVKADGLCAGKGVIIADTAAEADAAIEAIMIEEKFGAAGRKIIIEEMLQGEEASILVISDGENILPLASSQDHKRVYNGDQGPNTGGMGAYSPAPVVTENIFKETMDKIIKPVIKGMAKEGIVYRGVLYAGIMITASEIKALEFNCRFGDPETQALLPRLKTDLIEVMEAALNGGLGKMTLEWDERSCVCVVLASGGYPGKYEKGRPISGLDIVENMEDVVVFHAGTKLQAAGGRPRVVTNGGRVLGVTGLGADIEKAIARAYEAAGKIHFEGMHYRRDIADRAL